MNRFVISIQFADSEMLPDDKLFGPANWIFYASPFWKKTKKAWTAQRAAENDTIQHGPLDWTISVKEIDIS